MSDVALRFADLFQGRNDAFGSEEGGCIRVEPEPNRFVRVIESHLQGKVLVGVYPMVPVVLCGGDGEADIGWQVKWGCIDLDVKREGKRRYDYETQQDAYAAAIDLVEALALMDMTAWIEITRSGGFHVWLFAEDWVPASSMRRALLVACKVADVPPSEVNPKAETLSSADSLGNYVRLPYPGCDDWTGPPRRVMLTRSFEVLPLDDFLDAALACRATEAQIRSAAALYNPPPAHKHRAYELHGDVRHNVEFDDDLLERLNGRAFLKLCDGPLDDVPDRSIWLYTLAVDCASSGLDVDEAIAVVTEADERWTRKFVGRPDGDRQIERCVERAFR